MHAHSRTKALIVFAHLGIAAAVVAAPSSLIPNRVMYYPDGRPVADFRMEAKDSGRVLRHNDGGCPGNCDKYGARDVWTWEYNNTYYMHYDAAGDTGWLFSLAVSKDMVNWEKRGPKLGLGAAGTADSKSAAYGVPYFDGKEWHLFYLGTPNATPPPNRIPALPYLTLKAKGPSPEGPWTKQYDVTPFSTKPGSYYSASASPGHILESHGAYRMFFSASDPTILRTLGIARTSNLDGPWVVDPDPILPATEQVENTYLHYEKAYDTWFLFTNHVGLQGGEYTDAVWVYWTRDLDHWDPADKAVVLDSGNCTWAKGAIGLPSLLERGNRLAVFYDGVPGNSVSHMGRDVGLAWLDLPLVPLYNYARATAASGKATVRVSSVLSNWTAASLIDGDRSGAAWKQGAGWADSTRESYPDWVEFEFDKVRAIRLVNVFTLQDNYAQAKTPVTRETPALQEGISDFTIQGWNGTAWVTVPGGTVKGNDRAWRQLTFAPMRIKKLRVRIDAGRQGYSRLIEVEAWGEPIRGCIDPKSNNFDPDAEFDDGSCTPIPSMVSHPHLPSGMITRHPGGFSVRMAEGERYTLTLRDLQGRVAAVLAGTGTRYFEWRLSGVYWVDVRGEGGLEAEAFLPP